MYQGWTRPAICTLQADEPGEYATLFAPIRLQGVTARNRIVASPKSQYCSQDGAPTDWQLVNLARYAIGGAGIVF